VVVLVARGEDRLVDPGLVQDRLDLLPTVSPLVAGRLRGGHWSIDTPPVVEVVPGPVEFQPALPLHPFDLAGEAPLRVVIGGDGTWLALCAHHFAFDGLGMVSVLRSLLTGHLERASVYTATSVSSQPESRWPLFRRLVRPVDPVAPSRPSPSGEVLESQPVELSGKRITARLADACSRAVVAHNRARGERIDRIGITAAVGGVGGDSATYRRIDLDVGDPVLSAVDAALAVEEVPRDAVSVPRAARLLAPVLGRLSDTILVSNLGRLDLVGVHRVDFFPVARGRSAVAFGAASARGGESTLSIRARRLDRHDARSLLERAIAEMA